MEDVVGFVRVLARTRVKSVQTRPLIGKPSLKLGQGLLLGAYFFQLGGLLGAKYAARLDAFGPAFLGVKGAAGAVHRFFAEVAQAMDSPAAGGPATFFDYVIADGMRRLQYSGDPSAFFRTIGSKKVSPDSAVELIWQHAESGAALGAIHPNRVRDMFDQTRTAAAGDAWANARAAGLDIPLVPDSSPYEEIEKVESDLFLAYCRECCPDHFAALIG